MNCIRESVADMQNIAKKVLWLHRCGKIWLHMISHRVGLTDFLYCAGAWWKSRNTRKSGTKRDPGRGIRFCFSLFCADACGKSRHFGKSWGSRNPGIENRFLFSLSAQHQVKEPQYSQSWHKERPTGRENRFSYFLLRLRLVKEPQTRKTDAK
jgi:hypothetical protein